MMRLLPVVVLALAGCRDTAPAPDPTGAPTLELVFEFDDKAGLEAGAPVMLRGFEVGTVESVTLKHRVVVEVRVAPEHREAVRSKAYGRIREPLVGDSHLEIVILDPDSPPIADRATLPGADSDTEAAYYEGRQKARELGEALRDEAGELGERAGEMAREGADKARETYRTVRDSEPVEKSKEAVKEGARTIKRWFE